MTDEQLPPTEPAAEEPAAEEPRADEGTTPDQHATTSQAREWLAQLQQMIDQVAAHAGPVARDVAAKAAELAAVAGEKAGPLAKRAADKTEEVGARVAGRSRRFAEDLRHRADGNDPAVDSPEPPAGTAPTDDEAAGA
jgi:hypothetical protein